MPLQNYTENYVVSVYQLFARAIRESTKEGGNARCVLGYVSYGTTDAIVVNMFQREVLTFPFADKSIIEFNDRPKAAVGESVNTAIEMLREQAARAKKSLHAIEKEIQSAANRTPMLLPTRAFGGDAIDRFLRSLTANLLEAEDPFAEVREEVDRFCKRFPRRRFSDDRREYFINRKGIVFRTGGPSHGASRPEFQGHHDIQCFPRSRLRLGGSFNPAFHYDCCASQGDLPSLWTGCHGQSISIRRQYANVYPNDYAR